MRMWIFMLALLPGIKQLQSQKKALNFKTPDYWPTISCKNISNDGRYIAYVTETPAIGSELVVQATNGRWKKEITGIRDYGKFTEDSHRLVFFTQSTDSLCILELENDSLWYIGQVSHDVKMPKKGNGRWLAYRANKPDNALIVLDLFTGNKINSYPHVDSYMFNGDGGALVMTRRVIDSVSRSEVIWVDLNSGDITTLCSNCFANNFVFDESGSSVAFLKKEQANQEKSSGVWYYKVGMRSAESIIDSSLLLKGDLFVANLYGFNPTGDDIYFYIDKAHEEVPKFNSTVTIWNYREEEMRNDQEDLPRIAVVHLRDHNRMVRIQKDGDFTYFESNKGGNGDYALVESASPTQPDRLFRSDLYLVSTDDGNRRLVTRNLLPAQLHFSIGGKFIVWYDEDDQQWFTYNISKGIRKCITAGMRVTFHFEKNTPSKPTPLGIAGWLENDEAVLIYDRYDIWKVDPNGIVSSVNLTHGYGMQRKMELRFLDLNRDKPVPIRKSDSLIIWGFDLVSKYNSFYRLLLDGHGQLHKLSGDSTLYYCTVSADFPGAAQRFYPMKAKYADVYIVRGMSTKEYPNLNVTTDFRKFEKLTELEPQKEYNWYTTELIHWPEFDGTKMEGILFKPENFDPKRKYPIIFYYYEKSADALNFFIHPDLSNGCLNIPWFVSNEYLVFVPDIHYKDGYPGQSAFTAVVSAAEYLSKRPYIDNKHMGLQGHSFGGFETYYIVTKTDIFSAAAPSAGTTNLVSQYGQVDEQQYYERGQGRIGASLWDRRDLYIENSAIFNANRVITPILIMHNIGDRIVGFSQAEEWFSGLKRLGKRVWMLSYDGEDHTIDDEKNKMDYSIRLEQFFDYYLKGALPPKWMTNASLPGRRASESGLELDCSGKKP